MLIKHTTVVLVVVLCYVTGDNTRSVTFVIDDTISMHDEITQVKQKTHDIFNALIKSNESQIDEFIIVTFNDFSESSDSFKKNGPHAKLLIIARDEAEFKKALNTIYAHGYSDCPEMAMAGIEMALKNSKPNSYVYIFTDAAAKDYEKYEYIKSLSQKRMIQITFLLTGKCKKVPKEANLVYDKLATATSGQVFHIGKQDVNQIIEYIIVNIKSKRTTLARKTFDRGCENEFKFTVDSRVWYVLISVSAEDPVFRYVIGPDGVEAKIEEFVRTNHTYIVKLKGDPGEYTINVTSCDETSIVVTASTSVSFMYGFSPTKPSSLDETSTKPIPDKQSYLAIQLDNKEKDVTLETVELRAIDDNLLKELPLKVMDEDKQFYITELFDPPKVIFKIAIIGYTKIKEKIIRVSQTTLEGHKPTDKGTVKKDKISPLVTILAKNEVISEYDKDVTLKCKVKAFPEPKITWEDELHTILPSTVNMVDPPNVYVSTLVARVTKNTTFVCKAKNDKEDFDIIQIIPKNQTLAYLKERPIIDKNITSYMKLLKSNVDLLCRVIQGEPKPLITWQFAYNSSEKFIKLTNTNENFHIKNIDVNNTGTYRCNAVNEIGMDFHDMKVFTDYPPTVTVKSRSYNALNGEQVKLDCIVEGLPVPKVKWFKNDIEIKYESTLEDSGKYVCEATNYLDTARKSVNVIIYEPLKIETPEQSIFNATLNQSLTLPCRASGYPKPKLTWSYNSLESKERIPQDNYINKSLVIKEIQLKDEGYYTCFATNRVDIVNITYEVHVPVPPWITSELNNEPEVIVGDLSLELNCRAFGSPKPTITWTKNKSPIETDSGLYKVETNGNLIISNITMKTKGTYACKAENSLGFNKIEYKVNVHSYPPIQNDLKPVLLFIEGTKNQMVCDTNLKDYDLVRWFKDGKLLKTGELSLINVTKLDAGYYTCRVSNMKQSYSIHRRVIVGTKPEFIKEDSPTIKFKEGAPARLDCSAAGDPPPTTIWLRGSNIIKKTEIYDFIMNKKNIDEYRCIVSNEFGSIRRKYTITGGECLLNLENDLTARQPVMLYDSRKRKWPLLEKIDGFLKVPIHMDLNIWCPESFISYGDKNYGLSAKIKCIDGSVFELGDKNASFSEIICQKPVIPVAENPKSNKTDLCSGPSMKYFQIGFNISGLLRSVFENCFDRDKKMPIFIRHRIHPFIADMVPKHSVEYFESTHINLQLDDVYNCRNQLPVFTGETLKKDDICCFSRRQLVNPKDVIPGISQVATYHYLNVVPQWSTCGTENWDEVERRVRSYMLDINNEVYLWTGTSNGNTNVGDAIYLKDKKGQQLQVPHYIWKVIYKQLAIIHINIPNLKTSQTTDYILCKDICNTVEWMKSEQWHDVDKGFIYCCDIKEFETAFNFENLFELPNLNLSKDILRT